MWKPCRYGSSNVTADGGLVGRIALPVALLMLVVLQCAGATQVDLHGPAGSTAFGTQVTVLPNGNIVVTDPSGSGAVYLYSADGPLLSTLAGTHAGDNVGSGGVVAVGTGNFVVISPSWSSDDESTLGAVTWVDGNVGLDGVVTPDNSLVGGTIGDGIGVNGVVVLTNGNYVVSSPYWQNGDLADAGAATWGAGNAGIIGTVSAANSMVGASAGDLIGYTGFPDSAGITPLSNGNYVVRSPQWSNGSAYSAGAVTWGDGISGTTGVVSADNSLVGTQLNDQVGYGSVGVLALANGNYVVLSQLWNSQRGAATWANGTAGIVGAVSSGNSLVGLATTDGVGARATALANGNYVVGSYYGSIGAATWSSGAVGLVGSVSAANSLLGVSASDQVGTQIVALANGNYVVASPHWKNGATSQAGAVTWADGSAGVIGTVSAGNSLVGTHTGDQVGNAVTALSNGNFVVGSPHWANGALSTAGAVTWCSGSAATVDAVSPANSLVGAASNDQVGNVGVFALTNANFVVASQSWNANAGAVTWGNGSTGLTGQVSVLNSLVGAAPSADFACCVGPSGAPGVTPLVGGNYVVTSPNWFNGAASVGAVTWGTGAGVSAAYASRENSLVGVLTNELSATAVTALADGNYVVFSPYWSQGIISGAGAVTLLIGSAGVSGTIQSWNSVIGQKSYSGTSLNFSYDVSRHRLAVGRPADNIVSLLSIDNIFGDGFNG